MNATPYQRAMVESSIGHVAVVVGALLFVFVSGWLRPVEPAADLVQVAILAGPVAAGEAGAPAPDAKTDQDKNVAATPPPAPKPTPPPPEPPKPETPPEPVKPPETPLKEPDLPKIPDTPKPDDKPKPPDKPKPDDKPKPPETKPDDKPKTEKHQVRVQTNKLVVVQNKPEPASDKKKTQGSTQLSKAQIDALLKSGLNLSKNGGAGWGGGPPGSIARGTPSGALDMYKATLKTKLYNAWARPPGVEGLLTTIRISIAGNGSIIDADITRRSGNAKMDESALQAVRSVRPGPLPDGVRAPYALDVEFDASGVSV